MHIYFSGIGGTGVGPLALIAQQAGFTVSGSDQQDSLYIGYLQEHGVPDIHIGQTTEQIAAVHAKKPIDWLVHSSAISSDHAEVQFAQQAGIKISKRAEFINLVLKDKQLQMIAVAGTHGKTTTTAMVVWLFKQLGLPISYSVGAKLSFGDMGQYQKDSKYFVYEADEFDRNFLAFRPAYSLITGVSWDHHEIFHTRDDYKQAFRDFIDQSTWVALWQDEQTYLDLPTSAKLSVLDASNAVIEKTRLVGRYNRLDAWLAIQAVHHITNEPVERLQSLMHDFPGSQRRMEEITPGLYSDYAHTPEKVRGAMSAALETAQKRQLVVVFEPLHNRRQHYMINDYKDCFEGASKLYWLPSYLAREDPAQRIIPPSEMIAHLSDPSIGVPAERNEDLKLAIQKHLAEGDMVVGMAGGGGNSLDEWLRKEFAGD